MSGTKNETHAATGATGAHPATSDADKKAADAKAAKAAEPISRDLMVLLLVTDWLHGDKHHYDAIRKGVLKLLKDAGEDGAEALARLESADEAAADAAAAKPAAVKAAA
jgi:hypothetical protein